MRTVLVAAAGDELRRLADEHQPRHLLAVAGDGPHLLALLEVPDLDDVVGPAAGEQLAVRLPADVQDVVRVALERLEELAATAPRTILTNLSAPQVASILPSGLKQTPKTVSLWPFLMSATSLPRGHVEDLDLAVLGRGAAAGGQQLAVGREGQGHDAVGEAGQAAGASCPVWASQRITSWKLPLARYLPSGLKASDSTSDRWAALSGFLSGVGQVGIDQAADVGAGAGVVDVNLVAARGGDGRLVGADGDAADRLDDGRRRR